MSRSFTFRQGRSRAIMAGVCSIVFAASLSAQVTSVKLPAADSSASFRVLDSHNVVKMQLNGDGGFYAGGSTYVAGTIPVEGGGPRMMWYPKKAAFRAGMAYSTEWDNANIGQNSTAMGYCVTASNIYSTAIGVFVTASGQASTAMGAYVSTASFDGSFVIGDLSSMWNTTNATADNQMTMRFAGGYNLFTNGNASVGVSLAAGANSWAQISDSTKKANFQKADGVYFLSSLSKLKLGSWNYKTQDAKNYRHYGPMAQEIYHWFGRDGHGTIGNDTTLSTGDMDGIMMICLQALEKRTGELQKANDKIAALRTSVDEMKSEMMSMKNELRSLAMAQTGKAQEKIALNTISKGQ